MELLEFNEGKTCSHSQENKRNLILEKIPKNVLRRTRTC